MWAIGIILYVMVFGGFPFEEPSRSMPRRSQNIIKRLLRVRTRPDICPLRQPHLPIILPLPPPVPAAAAHYLPMCILEWPAGKPAR